MRNIYYVLVSILLCLSFLPAQAQTSITMEQLADSLTAFSGFSSFWASPVKVKNLRVSKDRVTVRTNHVFKDLRWTPALVTKAKKNVSRWVLGHERGKVTIIAGRTMIDDLITDCSRGIMVSGKANDLTDRNIALYPSHGIYFNRTRQEWIWQRATLWTTVEDLYSQEYVRLIRQMLENAGADVFMPRAGLEQQEPGLSGMPQWTEGARYWLMSQNADSTLWDLYEGDEYKDDMKCRAMWINSLEEPIDLCLAFHTDGMDSGNDSSIVGTLVIYTSRDDEGNTLLRDKRDREKVNRNLADWIQTQVTADLSHLAPEWTRRQLREANYCESRVPVVPSLILELLSHKNIADMRYGLDPHFRFVAARAVYKGILRALNGKAAVVQPLPVQDLAIQPNGKLQWKATPDTLEKTATPTYYMVYIQENDGDWNAQQVERKTHLQLSLKPGIRYNFYVVAGNNGGLSMPSPVISAYRSEQKDAPMGLVVDAFDEVYGVEWFADSTYAGIVPGSYACEDRFTCAYIGEQWNFTRADLWTNDDNCGWGACYRDHAGQFTVGNTHNYSSLHGKTLQKMNISYVSSTAGMLDKIDTNYCFVDYICGRNRTPIHATKLQSIEDYLTQGGRLLLSTDHFSALDQEWTKTHLHATYYAAKATRSGRIRTAQGNYQILLEPNEDQLFTCHPEALKPADSTACRIATYEDMRCPAAVATERTIVYGFPLETTTQFEEIYRRSMLWILENKQKNVEKLH